MSPRPTDAYHIVKKLAMTPRIAEAEAFSKAARILHQARYGTFDYDAYAEALRFNQVLWTLVQTDLAKDASSLPKALRHDALNLSLFVDKQTIKALSDPDVGHLDPVIEIDRAIAQGLTPEVS